MRGKAFKLGIIGIILLLTLAIMTFLFKGSGRSGVAAELSPTPAAFVRQTPSIWEGISLEQIRFGPPRVVLTDTLGLRIVGWISSDEVLILRDTLPGRNRVAVEMFNVETKEVRRLAEDFSGGPVWNPAQQAIVYLQYDEVRRQRDLMWYSIEAREAQKLASDVVLPIVLVDGGKGAVAYSASEKALVGRSVDLETQKKRYPFARYAMRIPTPYEWIYHTAVSPDGKWQVVYNCEHFLLVNTEDGIIKELDLGEWVTDAAVPRWALRAQWSPDGRMLAVVATAGMLPNPIRFLLLLDPITGNLQEVSVSRPFVIYEAHWSPAGRFLLVSGAIDYTESGYAIVEHRLLDISTGRVRKITLLPDVLGGASFAWSSDGRRIIFNCTSPEQVALCNLDVEVEQ